MVKSKKRSPKSQARPAPVFFTVVQTEAGKSYARLMIDSLRAFGGRFANAPIWVFSSNPELMRSLEDDTTRVVPLDASDPLIAYTFGTKVAACARAEELAPAGAGSMALIDLAFLFVKEPALFELGSDYDLALRPVHFRNVGLPPSEPLDVFWKGIYAAVGVDDISTTTTSFVDGQLLRAYFNVQMFSFNPTLGLMRRWCTLARQLAGDAQFQAAACSDELHQTFLFQALLSAIAASSLKSERILVLPPAYGYPCDALDKIPEDRHFAALNDVVCFIAGDRPIRLTAGAGILVHEPLRSWLSERAII